MKLFLPFPPVRCAMQFTRKTHGMLTVHDECAALCRSERCTLRSANSSRIFIHEAFAVKYFQSVFKQNNYVLDAPLLFSCRQTRLVTRVSRVSKILNYQSTVYGYIENVFTKISLHGFIERDAFSHFSKLIYKISGTFSQIIRDLWISGSTIASTDLKISWIIFYPVVCCTQIVRTQLPHFSRKIAEPLISHMRRNGREHDAKSFKRSRFLSSSGAFDAADVSKWPGDVERMYRNNSDDRNATETEKRRWAREKNQRRKSEKNSKMEPTETPDGDWIPSWNTGSHRYRKPWTGNLASGLKGVSNPSISLAPGAFRSFNLHFPPVCAVKASIATP